jgi:hypothetical protein
MVDRAIGTYTRALVKAGRKLGELIESEDEAVALKAARAAVADLVALREHADLAGQLDALAERFAAVESRVGTAHRR